MSNKKNKKKGFRNNFPNSPWIYSVLTVILLASVVLIIYPSTKLVPVKYMQTPSIKQETSTATITEESETVEVSEEESVSEIKATGTGYEGGVAEGPEVIKPENDTQLRYCEEDAECISIDARCCGCSNYGEATSINEKYKIYWYEKLAEDCAKIDCPDSESKHTSCFSEPKCVNNECALVKSG